MKPNRMLAVCGLTAALCLSAGTLSAQQNPPANNPPPGGSGRRDRGNFDPAQFQQRMMDNIKERLGFTNDTDWAAVQPLVQKVMDARREVGSGGGSFFRLGRRSGGGGGGGDTASQSSGQSGRRSFFGEPSPEAEALQKAIDNNAPAAQIKDALDKFRASRKVKEAKLTQAQEDLRKVLSVRQEAQATLLGLVP